MKTITKDDIQDDGYIEFIEYRESLPQVFNTDLNLFPSVKQPEVTGEKIKLYDLFQKIKYNLFYDITSDVYLTNKYDENRNRNKEYDRIKEVLPAVCYNAYFDNYKSTANVSRINNIMFLDIDTFKTKQEAIDYKQKIIQEYDWIIAVYRSLSKTGLHIIINVDNIRDNQDYNKKYDYINNTYFNGMLDKTAKSLTRYTIIPCDYDIYINDHPSRLEVDKEFNNNKKGIRSTYNTTEYTFSSDGIKGISSTYLGNNYKEGIRSTIERERRVCTPYTFSPLPSLEDILNDSARKYNLKFQMELDESYFTDPDVPIYIHEGLNVIKINLFPYRYKKVLQGDRNAFIGAITIQMFYLNLDPNDIIPEIKRAILNFILSINKKLCISPLDKHEVITLFNSNFKRFINGQINYQAYYVKQRAFWSEKSTLRGNEKRKVTCRIKNEPIVTETKRKIKLGVERLQAKGQKITQKAVADEIDYLSLGSVKKYRDYYNELLGRKTKKPSIEITENPTDTIQDYQLGSTVKSEVDKSEEGPAIGIINEQANGKLGDKDDATCIQGRNPNTGKDIEITKEHKKIIFQRIFNLFFKRMSEEQKKDLYTKFVEQFDSYTKEDKHILALDIEEINESDIYWKQNNLDSKFYELIEEVRKPD